MGGFILHIFLSWSGDYSKALATLFYEWVPYVLQETTPFMSAQAIELGTGWNEEINLQLNQADLGIIFVTEENVNSPWLNFESGALAKSFDRTNKVIPILFDDEKKSMLYNQSTPLKQFQSVLYPDKEGLNSVIATINSELENPIDEKRLASTFEMYYPQWENKFNDLKDSFTTDKDSATFGAKNVSINDISDKIDVIMTTIQKNNVVMPINPISISPQAIDDLEESYEQIRTMVSELMDLNETLSDSDENGYLKIEGVIKNIENSLQNMRNPIRYLRRKSVRKMRNIETYSPVE